MTAADFYEDDPELNPDDLNNILDQIRKRDPHSDFEDAYRKAQETLEKRRKRRK